MNHDMRNEMRSRHVSVQNEGFKSHRREASCDDTKKCLSNRSETVELRGLVIHSKQFTSIAALQDIPKTMAFECEIPKQTDPLV